MIDINATDFLERFDIKKGTVGIVGYGYVGKAVGAFFQDHCTIVVHDKAMESAPLSEVVSRSEVIFVCVPTPMRKEDGSCHTGIVEEVLLSIYNTAKDVGRPLSSFVVVIKSTIPPGFTHLMTVTHPGLRLVFSPEFLTERNSIEDFKNTNRIVLGGYMADTTVAFAYFRGANQKRVESRECLVVATDSTTAEMVKLYTNGILMTKVLFSNEIYQVCKKLGVDYSDVRGIACMDKRIGDSHTNVPGPDGQLGAGGHCFPKDINNLRDVCRKLQIPERIFSAVIERNAELREDKDWERMEGRAVIGT